MNGIVVCTVHAHEVSGQSDMGTRSTTNKIWFNISFIYLMCVIMTTHFAFRCTLDGAYPSSSPSFLFLSLLVADQDSESLVKTKLKLID